MTCPTAKGTPSIESVELGSEGIESSQIKFRFHYYQNGYVDQLAHGTSTDFQSRKAWPADKLNSELIKQGQLGNLGDRDKFRWGDRTSTNVDVLPRN